MTVPSSSAGDGGKPSEVFQSESERKKGIDRMEESGLTRKAFAKTMALGVAALLLPQAKRATAAEVPSDVTLYTGEPSIGEPGYERRIAKIFEQATVKKM